MKNKKVWTITQYEDKNGHTHLERVNDGFTPIELLGLVLFLKTEIFEQMKGTIKPDVIKRTVVKGMEQPGHIAIQRGHIALRYLTVLDHHNVTDEFLYRVNNPQKDLTWFLEMQNKATSFSEFMRKAFIWPADELSKWRAVIYQTEVNNNPTPTIRREDICEKYRTPLENHGLTDLFLKHINSNTKSANQFRGIQEMSNDLGDFIIDSFEWPQSEYTMWNKFIMDETEPKQSK